MNLSGDELVLIQLLVFYLYSCSDVEIEKISEVEVKITSSLEFIKRHLERINESSIKLKFPKEFLQTLKEIFGIKLNSLVLSCEDFNLINDLECLQSINVSDTNVITDFYYDPNTTKSSNRYLSIDLGIKNPVTAVDSKTGQCLILGRDYMSRSYYYDKKIEELRSQYKIHGLDNFETKRMKRLKVKKKNTLNDILHKITRYLTNYCIEKNVTEVVVGDIKERPNSLFPFNQFFKQLERKLDKIDVKLIRQDEHYSSQCPPQSPEVTKEYAQKENRLKRGLFKDGNRLFNADGVGALNILKSYLNSFGEKLEVSLKGIESPTVVIVSD